MIDTSDKNFNINLNINIKNIRTRYQYQYQYCRIQNSISISIPIPKMIKFKLNLKTIPRYLDILRSQPNTQKIRASIAQLWSRPWQLKMSQWTITETVSYPRHLRKSKFNQATKINTTNFMHFEIVSLFQKSSAGLLDSDSQKQRWAWPRVHFVPWGQEVPVLGYAVPPREEQFWGF